MSILADHPPPASVLLCRIAGGVSLLAILVLSLVPSELRPHVLPGKHLEHFVAYLIAGLLLALGWRRDRQVLLCGVALAACSAVLEILQLWVPGRTSSVADFLASTSGALAGLTMIHLCPSLRGGRAADARTATQSSGPAPELAGSDSAARRVATKRDPA